MKKIIFSLMVSVVFMTVVLAGSAFAAWPNKPIQIVVPWPAANDPSTMILNAMAPEMSKELGMPVKVINHAGGAGVLGANKVASARPDGNTIGFISIGPMITQVLRGKTPYKNKDLRPLGLVWSSPFTLACRADAPYSNLKELSEYGKTHDLKLAHYSLGAVPTLIAMKAAQIGGFSWKETAYKKLSPLLVMNKDADVITYSITGLRDYIEADKMKILACMLPNRLSDFPDIPTVTEQGFGDAYSIWFGLFVPAKTDDAKVKILKEAFFKVMATNDIMDKIKKVGSIPHPTEPEVARSQMDSELANFGAIMKELKIIK
ncbi:MAG: tripartite tricarboxylate transporter substrate binding protein [Desulfobacteraceae bacterium]|nr:tripartite tricarboxylate transporter substrate binding protein [Desulfobacteraceae bacterium]